MSRPQLILFGAGGHARSCIDVIECCGAYEIAGLVGLPQEVGTSHLGYRVISTDSELLSLAGRFRFALVTVGQIRSADARIQLYRRLIEAGFELPTIISPLAHMSPHASLGHGSIVMHSAVVNAGADIGRNCIVNTRALVEHDAAVGDHSHIATGAILNGSVRVGSGTHVGSGSVIMEGVSVGDNCIVGMGLAVRHDLPDGTRFVGESRA
jgi:sugar O-acyltransferase (sialic acid O-acetyltransferase NeuD family)